MLSTDELTAMRATVDASLPDTAQVQRLTRVEDGRGGYTESWATIATVACRVGPRDLRPDEQVIAERLAATTLWTITLPAGTDVKPADRVITGARTYQVGAPGAPRSWEVARRVVAVVVE